MLPRVTSFLGQYVSHEISWERVYVLGDSYGDKKKQVDRRHFQKCGDSLPRE